MLLAKTSVQPLSLDQVLTLISISAEVLCIACFFVRGAYKALPVVTSFLGYLVISDVFGYLVYNWGSADVYRATYFTFALITYVLELGVMWELAVQTLAPIRRLYARRLRVGTYVSLCILVLITGVATAFVSYRGVSSVVVFFLQFDLAFAIFRVLGFGLILACMAVLGGVYDSLCAQVVGCLAVYSVSELAALIAHEVAATRSWQYANFLNIERLRTGAWWVTMLALSWLAVGARHTRGRSAGGWQPTAEEHYESVTMETGTLK